MADFISEIAAVFANKVRGVLATIISSSGSSPLPAGSMMLVQDEQGKILGTVGGGLLELRTIEAAIVRMCDPDRYTIHTIDLNDDVSNVGMICGGSVDMLLESVDEMFVALWRTAQEKRSNGEDCLMIRAIDEVDHSIVRFVVGEKDAVPERVKELAARIRFDLGSARETIHRLRNQDAIRRVRGDGGEILLQPFKGVQQLIIFGGGHIAMHLSTVAALAGFSVTVVDDRSEFADPERFPRASQVLFSEYENAFSKIGIYPTTSIVIVTRGHQADTEVLAKAIETPARYVGMIGSKRKVLACFSVLEKRGIPFSALEQVHAPIGLDIGAVTAEEIAVSIVAELIRVRRGMITPSLPMSDQIKQFAKHVNRE
jgi:xanthine dehydrogenase accessory factor